MYTCLCRIEWYEDKKRKRNINTQWIIWYSNFLFYIIYQLGVFLKKQIDSWLLTFILKKDKREEKSWITRKTQ